MKVHLFFATLFFAGVCIGCQEDENLNLIGYPENSISVTTPDDSENLSDITVQATYDDNGKLIVASPLKRTWHISLSTPSPQDVVLQVAPIAINIPQEKVEISATSVTIPAGSVTAEVTVGIKNDDLTFAEEEFAEKTYALGLQIVNGEGVNLNMETAAGKLIIEKEAYQVHVAVAGENGNVVNMRRVYKNGEVTGDPIRYAFSIQLDRPLKEDLAISFITEGIAENFKDDITYTPSEVVIPAGSRESDVIEWAVTNDFLMTTEEDEVFNIVLKPVFESAEYVLPDGTDAVIKINLVKSSSALEFISEPLAEWEELNKDNWVATFGQGWSGDAGDLIDGQLWTNVWFVGTEEAGELADVTFDLQEEKELAGFWAKYTLRQSVCYAPTQTEIFISSDNLEWTSIGTVETPSVENHYIKFSSPVKTRYVKYRGTVNSNFAKLDVKEMTFYGLKVQ